MGKISIIAAMIVWVFMGVRLIGGELENNNNILAAFNKIDYLRTDTIINASGELGIYHMNDEKKKEYAVKIAAAIGFDNDFSEEKESEDGREVMIFTKNTGNASIKITLTTISKSYMTYKESPPQSEALRRDDKESPPQNSVLRRDDNEDAQYINICFVVKERVDCALSYLNLVEEIFEADGINGEVSLNLRGELKGACNYYERDRITQVMLDSLKAKTVSQNRDSDNYTIYGYTDLIKKYAQSCGQKVNVNVTQTYDEKENVTVVYLSTPFCNLDY